MPDSLLHTYVHISKQETYTTDCKAAAIEVQSCCAGPTTAWPL